MLVLFTVTLSRPTSCLTARVCGSQCPSWISVSRGNTSPTQRFRGWAQSLELLAILPLNSSAVTGPHVLLTFSLLAYCCTRCSRESARWIQRMASTCTRHRHLTRSPRPSSIDEPSVNFFQKTQSFAVALLSSSGPLLRADPCNGNRLARGRAAKCWQLPVPHSVRSPVVPCGSETTSRTTCTHCRSSAS